MYRCLRPSLSRSRKPTRHRAREIQRNRAVDAGGYASLYVSIQNVWLISHGRVLKKRFASARRDFFPPSPAPSRVHPRRPPVVICGMRERVRLSHQNWTPLASSSACTIRSRGPFAPPFVGFRGRVIDLPFSFAGRQVISRLRPFSPTQTLARALQLYARFLLV